MDRAKRASKNAAALPFSGQIVRSNRRGFQQRGLPLWHSRIVTRGERHRGGWSTVLFGVARLLVWASVLLAIVLLGAAIFLSPRVSSWGTFP